MDAHEPAGLITDDSHATDPADKWLTIAKESDRTLMASHFTPADVQQLHGEINVLRYRPCTVAVRGSGRVTAAELERVVHAGSLAGADVEVSLPKSDAFDDIARAAHGVSVRRENANEFAERLPSSEFERVRAIGEVEDELRAAIHARPEIGLFSGAVVSSGRVEILAFVREQAVSATNHRYGNPLPYDLKRIVLDS